MEHQRRKKKIKDAADDEVADSIEYKDRFLDESVVMAGA